MQLNNSHFRNFSAFSKRVPENSIKKSDIHRVGLKNSNSKTTLDICPTQRSQSQANQTLNNLVISHQVQSPRLTQFHIKAFIRFKPQKFTNDSSSSYEGNINKKIAIIDKKKILCEDNFFTYDQVFEPPAPQPEIYNCVCKQMVEHFVRGFNSTVFAYGQTGSGKTYTMFGDLNEQQKKGIIPSAIKDIFSSVKNFPNENMENNQVIISCSMLQIYKQTMIDLLSNQKGDLKIKENQFFNVSNLTIKQVGNEQEMHEALKTGNQSKKMRETSMNEASSRSHVIFTVYLEVRKQHQKRLSKFNLVDLAGSQKVSKSKVQGEGLQEAKKINLSLSCLGNTINALLKRNDHIPYRESKLTRLLYESLGGNSLTRLIVTCSSEDTEIQQTLGSLKFASRAKNLKTNPLINTLRKSEKSVSRIAYENLKTNYNKAQYKISKIKTLLTEFKLSSPENQFLPSSKKQFCIDKENRSIFSNSESQIGLEDDRKHLSSLNLQLSRYKIFAQKVQSLLASSNKNSMTEYTQKSMKKKENLFGQTLSSPFLLIQDSGSKQKNMESETIQILLNSSYKKQSENKKKQKIVQKQLTESQGNEYWKIIKNQERQIVQLKKKINLLEKTVTSSPNSDHKKTQFSLLDSCQKHNDFKVEICKSMEKQSRKSQRVEQNSKKCRKLNVKISGKVLPVRQIFLTSPTNSSVFNRNQRVSQDKHSFSNKSKKSTNSKKQSPYMSCPQQFVLTQQKEQKVSKPIQNQLREISKKLDRKNEYEKFEKHILLRQLQLLFDEKHKELPQSQQKNQFLSRQEKNKKITLSETNELLVSQIRYIQQLEGALSHCLNEKYVSSIIGEGQKIIKIKPNNLNFR